MVEDEVAQKLEAAGLWRRASARWLVLMHSHKFTDSQRDWVWQRGVYCLKQIAPRQQPEKLDTREIAKAADAVLAAMGIAGQNRIMFRKYPIIND